jgi:outer membrane protein
LSFPSRCCLWFSVISAVSVLARAQALSPAKTPTQPPGKTLSGALTLAQAEKLALANHPFIQSATLSAEANKSVVDEAKSAYYPTAAVNVTSAAANDGTVLSAGALQTSSLNSRFATGVNILQLVTDFGRTGSLVNAAKFRYQAATDNVINARAQILLGVRRAYFGVLGSESVRRAAAATLSSRQLTLRQVSAMAQSSLRSTLDVTFAEVTVSEAQLAVDQAENNVQANRAALAAILGVESLQNVTLEDLTETAGLDADIDAQVTTALRDRPDFQLVRHTRDAAYQIAQAEKKLMYPTVSLQAIAGAIPEHDHTIARHHYEAAGVNINIPVFNGGLFAARRSEALSRAKAADKDVDNLSLQIGRDVRTAWYNANNAFRRLSVTSQLVEQARRAVRLSQARYDAGLGSIVELTQAQTSQISAEINAAAAKYEYLSRRTELEFTTGALR